MNGSAKRVPLSTRLAALALEGLKLFGIAVSCLIVFALIIIVSIKHGIVIPHQWFALSVWTGFMIWVICRQYRPYLKHATFWLTLLSLMLVHTFAFIAILRRFPEWPMIWYWPVTLFEVPLMGVALNAILMNRNGRSR
jgi:hypothetical protein